MKKVFLAFFTVLSMGAMAQTIDFGVKAGLAYPTDDGVISAVNSGIESKGKGAMGFQGGLMMRAKFMGFYVQPELLYSQFKYKDFDETGETDVKLDRKRMDIPVNVGKTFAMGLVQLQTGPVFSVNFEDAVKMAGAKLEIADRDKFNIGWQIGTGLNLKDFNLDLRYEFGLSKTVTKIANMGLGTDVEAKTRTNMLLFSAGYFF